MRLPVCAVFEANELRPWRLRRQNETSRNLMNCGPISTRSGKYQKPSRDYYVTSFPVGKETVPLTRSLHKQFEQLFAMMEEMKAGQEEMRVAQAGLEQKMEAGQESL
ncbi:hypothetical protein AVEN_263370-1 [Araneus ventricosus]|uniref:Uncharacterized protein n=1 Tax=Araneus ventricosus TaxID=182803 RepID=A0A4Y2D130_ARAVE|nr:hypothetical protein AVEN_263370-1 [Araneus ventricosus]